MSSLETTELKLKSTPTGGVDAAQSPYSRRLTSAGYKGFLQGTVGGSSLYGMFGLVIGLLAATPFIGPLGLVGYGSIVAACTGLGVLKGSDVFGRINSTAAMLAEFAEMSEVRRYLFDRYHDIPDGPEGDKEADAIKKEIIRISGEVSSPPSFFHGKSMFIGAVVGCAFALGAAGLLASGVISGAAISALIGVKAGAVIAGLSAPVLTSIGAAVGALAGATIGIDRYYIRKWFDFTQDVVHPSSHRESALMERHKQVERIVEAAKQDAKTKQKIENQMNESAATPAVQESEPKNPTKPVASLDKPTTQISSARREGLAAIQKAMEIPVV